MRNINLEAAIWNLFTSFEFFEAAGRECETTMQWMGSLAVSKGVANFGRNNQIFDVFKKLARDFERGTELARLGDYELMCGGAYIKIADGNIEHGCAGDFTVKAAMHKWDGPAEQEADLPFFPAAEHTSWLKLDLNGYQGVPMAGVPYTLHFADGQKKHGTLDGNGMAEERNLPDSVDKVVYHNDPTVQDETRPTVSDLLSDLDQLLTEQPSLVDEALDQGGK